MKTYKLIPCEAPKGGINGHSRFYDEVSGIEITSNNDVLGDKWYMTNGEGSNTIWYKTPTEAIKAYLKHGEKAIKKE